MENEMATKGFNGAIWSLRLTCQFLVGNHGEKEMHTAIRVLP